MYSLKFQSTCVQYFVRGEESDIGKNVNREGVDRVGERGWEGGRGRLAGSLAVSMVILRFSFVIS